MNKTLVYLIADLSGSMAGPKAEKLRQMSRQLITQLAAEEAKGGQVFEVYLVPFSNTVEVWGPWPASAAAMQVERLQTRHPFGGGTAMRDAIGATLQKYQPRAKNEVALMTVISDGEEAHSLHFSASRLSILLKGIESSGNLTLTFAGPASAKSYLSGIGIPEGNFQVWDGDERSMTEVVQKTSAGLSQYIATRAVGQTSSKRFYADIESVAVPTIRAMTKEVVPTSISTVTKKMGGRAIADFFGTKFDPGSHYYQLVKPEYVQENKELVIFIKSSNEYRQGSRAVRALLGLPEIGRVRVYPGPVKDKYDVYVQSTSMNRKVVEGQVFVTLK